MKKIIVILSGIMCGIFANPVDLETAKSAAQTFIIYNNPAAQRAVRQTQNLTLVYAEQNEPPFYVFNADKGFVIVSGDDAAEPILAYSESNLFDAENINPALKYWLDGYERQLAEIRKKEVSPDKKTADKWKSLKAQKRIRTANDGVKPLTTAKWDQSRYFNDSCPVVEGAIPGYNNRAPVGCVAVAMGQIMNHWKYPLEGIGAHSYTSLTDKIELSADFATSYNWSIIPDSIDYDGVNYVEAFAELAKLLFHLGVAVEMDYTAEGSGAYTYFRPEDAGEYPAEYNAQIAFEKFFGYDSTITGVEKSKYYRNSSSWFSLIKKELDEGRPLIYTGVDVLNNESHAFVCDGYDADGKLHFNWGWGGAGNGYFLASNLSYELDDSYYNWNYDQDILIGIQPPRAALPIEINCTIETQKDTVMIGDTIKVSVNVSNEGTVAFNGDFCVIFYNDNGIIIDSAIISSANIPANESVVLNFVSNISPNLRASRYYATLYYSAAGISGNRETFDSLPEDALLKIVIRGDGVPIHADNKQRNIYGIIFAENPVSDRAEFFVNAECEMRKRSSEPQVRGEAGNAEFVIYDMTGNVVFNAELTTPPYGHPSTEGKRSSEPQAKGKAPLTWDLRNKAGRFVANGTYLVVVEAKDLNGKTVHYSAKLGVRR